MAQRNCHARSKQKRQALRLKNRNRSVFEKRRAKLIPKMKGKTIRGNAIKYAIDIHLLYPKNNYGFVMDHSHAKTLNQRQKRKRARAAGLKVKR